MENSIWSAMGADYKHVSLGIIQENLPKGVYLLNVDPFNMFYLTRLADDFRFGYKLYGIEDDFIQHFLKTTKTVTENLGILLNGIKGTGKTVTAKQICNQLNLPVIIVDQHFDGLPKFLSEISQEIVVFIDEYEKIFDKDDLLLSTMDGVLNSTHRRIFLLTTNELFISTSLLDRPGRIRYLKTFSNLDEKVYTEIVDDCLKLKRHRDAVLSFISTLKIVTVDVVLTICTEVDIHDLVPEQFKGFLNVTQHIEYFDLYLMDPIDLTTLSKPVLTKVKLRGYSEYNPSDAFWINGSYVGRISKIFSENVISVDMEGDTSYSKLIINELLKTNRKEEIEALQAQYESDYPGEITNITVPEVLIRITPIVGSGVFRHVF